MKTIRILVHVVAVLAFTNALSQTVVISEVYGGGGNSGATYKNDFVELYNPTNSPVDLTGWSVQYASSAGSSWQVTILSGTIEAHGYYLVQEAVGTGGTVTLPAPDAAGTIAMSATAGKIALVSSTTALTSATPASSSYVDLVGFGTAAFYEGTGPAAGSSNTVSVERKANSASTSASMQVGGADQYLGNGYDTNYNNFDFVTRAPEPQNAASGVEPDNTPPVFAANYPQVGNITNLLFNLSVHINENGKVYYVVLPDGATAPSSAQVKAGQDNGGNAVAISGFISVTQSAFDVSKEISGVSSGTSYDVYVVAEDLPGNLQPNPTLVEVTTNASTTPFILPSASSIGFGTVDRSKQSPSVLYTLSMVSENNLLDDVTVNVTGNFLVSPDDINYGTTFTIAKENFNIPQSVFVKFNPSGNIGAQTGTITHSSTGAFSNPVALQAIGIDPYNQDFNDPDVLDNSGWTKYSVTGAQVWASTNFGHTCLTGCNNATVDKAVQINGFSGSSQNNEDWLISPQLDLTTFTNFPAVSFATISAFAGDQLQLKYSTDYIGYDNPNLATWTAVDGKFPPSNSSLWTNSTNIILPKSKMYVAFIYTSNTTAASRWTLDDWTVSDVSSFLDVSTINFSFGEVLQGNSSAAQSFTFTAQGYGDVTVTVPYGFEVSTDSATFSESVLVPEAAASQGDTIYVRFSPTSKVLKLMGSVLFTGTGLEVSYGSLQGSSYPKAETFNIATYNMEFFGTDVKDASNVEFGPTDDALQVANVTTVLQTIGADVYAVEEISDDDALNQLVSNLSGYDKVISDRWSYSWQAPDPHFPPQKIGFIFKTSRVQLVSSRVMFAAMYDSIIAGTRTLANYPTGTSSSFWSSGRLPFMATFDIVVNGTTRRIRVVDIHGKSASDQESYNRRQYDANVLLDTLNTYYKNDDIIFLGDFNDKVFGSINTGLQSSYKSFVDDTTDFNAITYPLNVSGVSTFPNSASFIDNIIISNELSVAYVDSSVTVEDPRSYINNYITTTSDHLPVSARFLISNKIDQSITFNELPSKTFGDPAFALTGSASSGLAVSFSSLSNRVSISAAQVTIVGQGRVTITASQPGNQDFNAATPIDQSFCINPAKPAISVTNENTTSPTLTSSSSQGNQWYLDGTAINGATGATITISEPGTYTVQVHADDCVSAFSDDRIVMITGLEVSPDKLIHAYPNPAGEYLFISSTDEIKELQLYDLTGKSSMVSFEKLENDYRVHVAELPSGMYLLRVAHDGRTSRVKFVKR